MSPSARLDLVLHGDGPHGCSSLRWLSVAPTLPAATTPRKAGDLPVRGRFSGGSRYVAARRLQRCRWSSGGTARRACTLARARAGKACAGPVNPRLPGAAIAWVPCTAQAKVGLVAIRRLGGGDQRRRVRGSRKWGSTLGSVKLVTAEIRSPSMVRTSRPTACALGASSSWR